MKESPIETPLARRRRITDLAVKSYFGAHAGFALVLLLLICLFLFREAVGFFPGSLQAFRDDRASAMEFVGELDAIASEGFAVVRWVHHVQSLEYAAGEAAGRSETEIGEAMAPWRAVAAQIEAPLSELQTLSIELANQSHQLRARLIAEPADPAVRLAVAEEAAVLARSGVETFRSVAAPLPVLFQDLAQSLPPAMSPAGAQARQTLVGLLQHAVEAVRQWERRLSNWSPYAPVSRLRAIAAFFTGRTWLSNSFRQDVYGLLPLLTGSLLVASIALLFAVPLGLAAAVYVNQIAGERERIFLKPALELIAAIPSVVLGFFGIVVLGELLRAIGSWEWLSWLPGFPFQERLNALTAGLLLALMAVPTIFTLSEDALRAVPRSYLEASYAVGASRLETVTKVMLPIAAPGVMSAVLLGFGRVIGETMIVLLCAGNRIAIPDFSEGLGVVFQPVHTLTGIVAQEMGEVVQGSLHYRSLFVVGSFLFLLCLVINYAAQRVARRFHTVI